MVINRANAVNLAVGGPADLAVRAPDGGSGAVRITLLVACFLALFVSAGPAAADAPHPSVSCEGVAPPKSVLEAQAAFERDPSVLDSRLKFADALIDQGCYKQAVPVLETGQALFPRSAELQSRLRAARSMLSEEHFFEGLGNAQEAAKLQHSLLRCTKLADVAACDDGLKSKPGDPQLLIGKGDALLQGGHPADSLLVYRKAAESLPGDDGIKAKLAAAESQREMLVSRCENGGGPSAVEDCQSALLHGATDEFTLVRRKAILLQSIDRPGQALDAFIAANVLKQDDKSVALAIVALTASTGRQDALALAARGSALLALGRATESLAALRQAQLLAPTLPGLKSQLALAEKGARVEAKRAPVAAVAKANSPSRGPTLPPEAKGGVAQEPSRVATAETRTYSNAAAAGRSN